MSIHINNYLVAADRFRRPLQRALNIAHRLWVLTGSNLVLQLSARWMTCDQARPAVLLLTEDKTMKTALRFPPQLMQSVHNVRP